MAYFNPQGHIFGFFSNHCILFIIDFLCLGFNLSSRFTLTLL